MCRGCDGGGCGVGGKVWVVVDLPLCVDVVIRISDAPHSGPIACVMSPSQNTAPGSDPGALSQTASSWDLHHATLPEEKRKLARQKGPPPTRNTPHHASSIGRIHRNAMREVLLVKRHNIATLQTGAPRVHCACHVPSSSATQNALGRKMTLSIHCAEGKGKEGG